jgi:hypothetical protein
VEGLETRIVPAVKVVQNGALLKIIGDGKNDTVQINDNGGAAGGAITVTFNGKNKGNSFFSSTGPVTEVRIDLKGGDDILNYTLANPDNTEVSRKFDIKLGSGKDRFTGELMRSGL